MFGSRSRRFDIDTRAVGNTASLKNLSGTNLIQLPLDTLIQIQYLLSPQDIISLRKVNYLSIQSIQRMWYLIPN